MRGRVFTVSGYVLPCVMLSNWKGKKNSPMIPGKSGPLPLTQVMKVSAIACGDLDENSPRSSLI